VPNHIIKTEALLKMAKVPHPTKRHAALTYREPATVRVGRYAMTGGLVLLVLAVLYVTAWFFTSMSLRSGVQNWFEARKSEGYLAEYDDKKARISGFPFIVNARLSGVKLAPPKNKRGKRDWVWTPKAVDFKIIPLPWTVGTLHVEVKSKQVLSVGRQSYEGQAKEFDLAIDWTGTGIPDDISFDLANVKFEDKTTRQTFKISKLSAMAERQSDGGYAYDINGENVGLPVGISGMGRNVSDLILRGTFSEGFGQSGLGRDALAQWRDAGGTLESERMHLEYGPLLLQGNGTLALDQDLQLVGAFSARIQGFFQTVDRLRRAGVIRGPDASMAKVVLGMLSKPSENGGPASISLPLTLQERGLYAGPVRLINIPQLHW